MGYDGVDAVWAGQHGIVVTNTPDVLTDEVADLAMGLLIATIRRLPQADAYLRQGQWLKAPFPLTASLREKTMGILGLGRIGSAIAQRAEAFGLKLAYHTRSPKPGVPYRYYADLVEMARDVDILMVIAPGGASTKGIVSRAVMEALGPAGTLINVARGTLVDEPAMVELLGSGKLGAAGLDVFEKEPHVPEALFPMENVVLLPHVGSGSHYTRNKMGQLVVDNVISFAEGAGQSRRLWRRPGLRSAEASRTDRKKGSRLAPLFLVMHPDAPVQAILPPSSSSICTLRISSKVASARKPRATARFASKLRAQPATIFSITGSRSRRIRATTRSPPTRRKASICSPTVQKAQAS